MAYARSPRAPEAISLTANGLVFHAVAAGPPSGPLLILLHGFPEFSFGWRHQMAALAECGFRVVAPDQRGYGRSDKPFGAWSYRLDMLVEDVIAIADTLGHHRFMLAGHDWGGIVAWRVASDFGDRVQRLAILNAPNLDVAFTHALRSPGQLLKSSYVAMFQLPLLPELTLSSMNFAFLAQVLQGSSPPDTFSDEEIATYKEAWGQRGSLAAMLNWYRALALTLPRVPVRILSPTRILWGDRDPALDSSLAEDSAALCDHVSIHHFPDAAHWLHHERPNEVNAVLTEFFGGAIDSVSR